MGTSILGPFEFSRGPNRVPNRNAWRRDKQSPDESVGVEKSELPRVREGGDECGVLDPAAAGVGTGHRIGNHEEREHKQRAALELMRPHGPSLAEISDAECERAEMEDEEGPADVAAARAIRHERPEHHHPSGYRNILTPLAGRHPRAGEKNDREDDAEGGGIEQMLAAVA